MAGLHFDATLDNQNFMQRLNEIRNGISSASRQIEESGMSIEQMFGRLAKGAAVFGVGFSAQQFASQVMKVRGEFQQLEVAFNTMLGSEEKANTLMQQLVKTAATTPFDLQSVAGGAKQLLAYGVSAENVNGTLIRLGDIAAGLSIPLGDLVYLYGTTQAQGRLYTQDLNQFTSRGIPMIGELAKQFGVAESEVKKLVESGKVGFPEVQKVIESLTNEGGKFGGLMEAQSKTITGQISNIEDAIEQIFNELGKKSEGIISSALNATSSVIENWEKIGKALLVVISAYGAYKAAVIAVAAAHKIAAIWGEIQAFLSLTKSVTSAKDAMLLLNMATKANPIGLILGVVAAAAATFGMFSKNTSAAAEMTTKFGEKASTAITRVDTLTTTLKGLSTGSSTHKKVMDELNGILEEYGIQAIKEGDSIDIVNKKRAQAIELIKQEAIERQRANALDQGAQDYATKLAEAQKTLYSDLSGAMTNGSLLLAGNEEIQRNSSAISTIIGNVIEQNITDIAGKTGDEYQKGLDKIFKTIQSRMRSVGISEETISKEWVTDNLFNHQNIIQKYIEVVHQAKEEHDRYSDAVNKSADAEKAAAEGANTFEEKVAATQRSLQGATDNVHTLYANIKDLMSKYNENTIGFTVKFNAEPPKWMNDKSIPELQHLAKVFSSLGESTPSGGKTVVNGKEWTKQELLQRGADYVQAAENKQVAADDVKRKDEQEKKEREKKAKERAEAAKTLKKEQEKYNLLMDEQKREAARMKTDSQYELEQIEIDGLAEGSEKVLKQRELNHKKELEAIKREADDKKVKAIEAGRKAFEDDPANAKKTFDVKKDFTDLQSTKGLFASFDKTAEAKTKTENTKYNRGDDFKGLLDEYQDYTDKRLAIETKYNNDIAILDEQRKQAVKDGDTQQVEQIDRAKAQATKNKGMDLMGMDYDKLKESPEYVRAFENLKETSSETLNSLLSQLENAKGAAAKVLSPDQLREYTTTIQSIMDELDERNPFQSLSDKKKELAEAEEELARAQVELENARQTAEAVKGGAKIENGVKSSKFNQKTGKIDSTKAYLSEAQALEKVKDKTENYNEAKDKVVKKDAKVKKAEKEVSAQLGELSKTISDLGKSIDGPAGEIISLIGDIGTFALTAVSGVQAAADTSANAISTVEKASVILAVISAAVQIATKIFDMFGKDDTTENYEKAKEAYESYINILDRVIEKQLELAEALTGDNANAAYQKAIDTVNEQSKNAKVLGKQYLNSGASRKSHSKGYEEVDDMSWEGWNQAANALGMTIDDFKNKMGGRMTGLFDLTDEQLASLQENAGIFWSQLDSDTQEFADQIANGVGKITEILEQQMADTTLLDMSTLRSDFQDLLTDMDSDSASFADNFEGYMKNAIINSMIKEQYTGQLSAWREKFYNAMQNGVTEDEYNALKAEGQQISDEMLAKRKELADLYGWNNEDDEREASKEGFASMSQDSADELNGRFTVIQGHTYEINGSVKAIQSDTAKIAEKLSFLTNMDKNMSDMVKFSNIAITHLSNIDSNTARLENIEKTMNSIRTGIDTLNTKGLKLQR